MTITESRVKNGVLTLDTTEFSCQATNVHLTPNYDDDGDAEETLCGDKIPAGKKERWVIGGTSIQDFDDPAGFVVFCRKNAMKTVPFEWEPNQDGAERVTGEVVILAVEYGGDVNSRLTTDWEFDASGDPWVWEPSAAGTVPSTATAGTPGSWSGRIPATLAAANATPADYPANPATAWTTGEYVAVGDASHVHYDGAAYAAGDAP